MASITPAALAGALDVSEVWVREILRANYWEQAPGKGGRWAITPAMAGRSTGSSPSGGWRRSTASSCPR